MGEVLKFPCKQVVVVPYDGRHVLLLGSMAGGCLGLPEITTTGKNDEVTVILKKILPTFSVLGLSPPKEVTKSGITVVMARVELTEGFSPAGGEGTFVQSFKPDRIGNLGNPRITDPVDKCFESGVIRPEIWHSLKRAAI